LFSDQTQKIPSRVKLATSATLHCLLGCGPGEVVGVIIGKSLAMSNGSTIVLAVILGFVFGLLLGILPLLRAKFGFKRAIKREAISIIHLTLNYGVAGHVR